MKSIFYDLCLVQNGVSGNLMKASAVRRRSKAQIKEDKQAALLKEQEYNAKMNAWAELEAKLEQ